MIDGNAYYLRQREAEEHEVGTDPGDECGRIEQPDEDAPRGYRPKPCTGIIIEDLDEGIYCDTCGERP